MDSSGGRYEMGGSGRDTSRRHTMGGSTNKEIAKTKLQMSDSSDLAIANGGDENVATDNPHHHNHHHQQKLTTTQVNRLNIANSGRLCRVSPASSLSYSGGTGKHHHHHQRALSFAPPQLTRTHRKFSLFSFNQPLYLGMGDGKGRVEYENTYRTDLDCHERFKPRAVREATQQVVDDILDTCNYVGKIDSKKTSMANWSRDVEGGNLAKMLVKEVRDKLKTLNMKRHRLVVNALVCERKGQGLMMASRCLWDDNNDGHATVHATNDKVDVVVVVHAVHLE